MTCLRCLLPGVALLFGSFLEAWAQSPLRVEPRAPERPDLAARYLFYLHGQILEDQGSEAMHPEFGRYEYDAIVRSLADSGFSVISELRAPNTDPERYADSVAAQVRRLIDAGLPAHSIAVVGVSKGAVIAMLASTRLSAPIRYVLLANCNDWVLQRFPLQLHGEVLSIFETTDSIGRSCQSLFDRSPSLGRRQELSLNTGLRHGFIFRPGPWLGPTVAWARGGS